jgi:hypothetical protein
VISELISPRAMKGLVDVATYAGLQAENKVTASYQQLLKKMFADLVETTPQWSGNLAQNWTVQYLGSAQARYVDRAPLMQSKYGRTSPYMMGMDPAVTNTLNRELPKFDKIRWNTKVTFINKTPYAGEVAEGKGPSPHNPIRAVNLGPAGEVLMLNYVKMKYNNLGVNIV